MPEPQTLSINGTLLSLNTAKKNTNLDIEFGGADSRDKLLELARAKAPNPEIFDTNDPYFYFAEVSNDLVNCYYLAFQKSMLETWVDELKEGVQFQAFHQNSAPIGHSIYGWQDNKDGRERVIGAFYALPGIQLNQYMSNDSFIAGIKSGSLRDVSVGMFVDEVECSICGGDPMDWWGKWMGTNDCEHYLGERYPITDDKGKETGETVVCTGLVHSGELNEVSTVYKGGAPMAGIVPAMQLSRSEGLLDPRLQDRLETRFGLNSVNGSVGMNHINDYRPAWMTEEQLLTIRKNAKTVTPAKETQMTKAQEENPAVVEFKLADSLTDKQLARLKTLEIDTDDGEGNFDFGVLVESMTDKIVELADEVANLETDAKVGREYKAEKIEDAIAAGIRANGNEWKADDYKTMLEACNIDQVKMFLADLTKQGDAKFANPEGETRRTKDGEPAAEVAADNSKYNDPRFKS